MGGDSVRLRRLGTGGKEGTDDGMKKGHEHTGEASEESIPVDSVRSLGSPARRLGGAGSSWSGVVPWMTVAGWEGDAGAGINGFQSREIWLAV